MCFDLASYEALALSFSLLFFSPFFFFLFSLTRTLIKMNLSDKLSTIYHNGDTLKIGQKRVSESCLKLLEKIKLSNVRRLVFGELLHQSRRIWRRSSKRLHVRRWFILRFVHFSSLVTTCIFLILSGPALLSDTYTYESPRNCPLISVSNDVRRQNINTVWKNKYASARKVDSFNRKSLSLMIVYV